MMWAVASIPFALIGLMCAAIAIIGGYRCLRTDRTHRDAAESVLGIVIFLIGAGLFLLIAARVAS